jgi:hypothetical protein
MKKARKSLVKENSEEEFSLNIHSETLKLELSFEALNNNCWLMTLRETPCQRILINSLTTSLEVEHCFGDKESTWTLSVTSTT